MIPHNRLKLTVIKPFKKFHAFMESGGSVTEVHHFVLFWDGSVHFLLSRHFTNIYVCCCLTTTTTTNAVNSKNYIALNCKLLGKGVNGSGC